VTLANQIQSEAVAWQIYSIKKKMMRGDFSVEEPHISD
jgi:hypothetical protein